MKAIQCIYFKENDYSLKQFKNSSSNLTAFCFTRKNYNYFKDNTNYGIYFLYNLEENEIYIGKTTNGINRINDHNRNKKFWSNGILITSDSNDALDNTIIDFLEWKFINKFKETNWELKNREVRNKEPIITIYQRASINDIFKDIEFLLGCENIIPNNIEEIGIKSEGKIYSDKQETAQMYYDGVTFKLLKNSLVTFPKLKSLTQEHKSYIGRERFINRHTNKLNNLLEIGKAVIDSEGNYILNEDLEVNSPSNGAALCTGNPVNGWDYFVGINEWRDKN